MADFSDSDATPKAGRVTKNRDIVFAPNLLKWAYEGKLWTAGVGIENAGIDSDSAWDDLAPGCGLVAPASSRTLILPIMVRVMTHTEGGAAPYVQVCVTRAASDCATTLTVSGTALTAIQNHNVTYTTSPSAACTYTCTASALTNADYQSIIKGITVDNTVANTGGNVFNRGTVLEIDMLEQPRILHSGAALLVYVYTGTTDTKYTYAITWAELTESDFR